MCVLWSVSHISYCYNFIVFDKKRLQFATYYQSIKDFKMDFNKESIFEGIPDIDTSRLTGKFHASFARRKLVDTPGFNKNDIAIMVHYGLTRGNTLPHELSDLKIKYQLVSKVGSDPTSSWCEVSIDF
ncbi:hypothetical protein JTB14_004122 [Gonioctena quinquepunctata]|nr:hypothetical protein JTB14_004122 [Gonioctena quinquepunctata]